MVETVERQRDPKQSLLPARTEAAHLEPPAEDTDLALWKAIAGLLAFIAILIAALIALCFIVAKLVTGYAV
jgi:hypothetical protein